MYNYNRPYFTKKDVIFISFFSHYDVKRHKGPLAWGGSIVCVDFPSEKRNVTHRFYLRWDLKLLSTIERRTAVDNRHQTTVIYYI